MRKYNKEIRYLSRVIDLFSKYTFVVPLKDKKCISEYFGQFKKRTK